MVHMFFIVHVQFLTHGIFTHLCRHAQSRPPLLFTGLQTVLCQSSTSTQPSMAQVYIFILALICSESLHTQQHPHPPPIPTLPSLAPSSTPTPHPPTPTHVPWSACLPACPYLVWVLLIQAPNHALRLVSVGRVAAVNAELGKLQLLAAKLREGAAAAGPGRVAHLQGAPGHRCCRINQFDVIYSPGRGARCDSWDMVA